MDEKGRQIYRDFAGQLCQWAKTGKAPAAGNQDIGYGLSLQKARLERFRVDMEYVLERRGEGMDQIFDAEFSDTKYTNSLVGSTYRKIVNYYIDGKKCRSFKDNETLYAIITRLNHSDGKETYCCPNCGTISRVEELAEGCPYCKTRFLMSDLFPKVTNFHFLRSYGMGENEIKNKVSIWVIGGVLITAFFVVPGAVTDFLHGEGIMSLVGSGFGVVIVGSVFGYVAWAVKTLAGLFRDGFRQAPMAVRQISAKKKLTEFMKSFDPVFSFEYFVGKVQALIKILIFTDDRRNLAVYEGPLDGQMFDNIVDAQFGGAISLNDCRVKGDYCYLDLNVHMTDVYCQNNRLIRKRDIFQMGLCKNIRRPVNYGFSIKMVSCISCGASFDASKERKCPYCGTDYHLGEDDWVITFIRKL